jgi:hypothetical protein
MRLNSNVLSTRPPQPRPRLPLSLRVLPTLSPKMVNLRTTNYLRVLLHSPYITVEEILSPAPTWIVGDIEIAIIEMFPIDGTVGQDAGCYQMHGQRSMKA